MDIKTGFVGSPFITIHLAFLDIIQFYIKKI